MNLINSGKPVGDVPGYDLCIACECSKFVVKLHQDFAPIRFRSLSPSFPLSDPSIAYLCLEKTNWSEEDLDFIELKYSKNEKTRM